MMKKNLLALLVILILLFTLGCRSDQGEQPEPADPGENNPPVTEDPQEPSKNGNDQEPPGKEELSLENYYPIAANKEYRYEGEGMEYASYRVLVDYIDPKSKRVQTRTNNGGTEMVKVLEIGDKEISVLYSKEEVYYRDNLLKIQPSKDIEILLKEPIQKGTHWTLPDGRVRTITNTSAEIRTPLGNYRALEVTTEGKHGTTKDYYAPNVGLVKSVFSSEGSEVTSTLSKVKDGVPFKRRMELFYPGQDQRIHVENKSVQFNTNDISRINIQKIMAEKPPKDDLLPLISPNTKINALYLGDDGIAYVDFSKEFIRDRNVGASYESLALQSVVNTIGQYYGVDKVYLTIDGKPYESGHILLKKGEVLRVDRKNVIQ